MDTHRSYAKEVIICFLVALIVTMLINWIGG